MVFMNSPHTVAPSLDTSRLAAVIKTAVDGIITITPKGLIETFNPAAERLFGYSAAEVIGKNVNMLMPAPHKADHDSYLHNYLATGRARIRGSGRQVEGLRKDGTVFPMELSVGEIQDETGKCTSCVGIIRDVTDRVQAEFALQEQMAETALSASNLSAIIETVVDAVITISPLGIIDRFNFAAEELFGYSASEVIGKNVSMLMPEEDSVKHDRYVTNYRETGHAKIIGIGRQVEGMRRDGTIFPMELSVGEITNQAGSIIGFVGTVRDVSSRVAAAQDMQRRLSQLSLLTSHLSAVIDTAVDGIITIDPNGIIQSFNPAAQLMFGYTEGDVKGKNVKMLMPNPDKDRHDTYISNYKTTGNAKIIGTGRMVTGLRSDGSTFPMDLSVGEIMATHGRSGFVGIIRDVTERESSKKQLEIKMEELKRSNNDLERFAYVASHDLKTPLRGIQNLADWIEENIRDYMDEETERYMGLLKSRVHRLEGLLSGLLQYSRAGGENKPWEDLNLNSIVSDVGDLLAVKDRGFKLEYNLPELVRLPRAVITQVFHNLISNAMKHHDTGKGTITILYEKKGPDHLITVQDDGPGIPSEMADKVFKMFETLRPRDEVEGSGMGLAIVKKLIDYQGGEIWIDYSAARKGTAFKFTLPIK